MAREEVEGKRLEAPPKFPKREGALDPDVIAKKIVDKALADDEPVKRGRRRKAQ